MNKMYGLTKRIIEAVQRIAPEVYSEVVVFYRQNRYWRRLAGIHQKSPLLTIAVGSADKNIYYATGLYVGYQVRSPEILLQKIATEASQELGIPVRTSYNHGDIFEFLRSGEG